MPTRQRLAKLILPFIICGLGTSFVLYEFIIQVSPSVMTTQLMRDLHIHAAALGTISAFYYYAYSPMQIPAGMLYDRWGPRKLITSALLVCALGAMFFSITDSLFLASFGRLLTGIGSAFSYIGALFLIAKWFPPRYFALGSGIVQLSLCVGAMIGQAPIAEITEHIGWRNTMMWVALIGFFFAAIIWIVVRDGPESYREYLTPKPKKHKEKFGRAEWENLKSVCKKSQTWWIALFSGLLWSPTVVFAGLWGIPYIINAYHVNVIQASGAISILWLGIAVGSPLVGWLSDKYGRRLMPLMVCALLGFFSSLSIILNPDLSWPLLLVALFAFGLGGSAQALTFVLVKEHNKIKQIGTAIGFNNMAIVSGGALMQPLVGLILQHYWQGQIVDGSPFYHPQTYRIAFIMLPVCYFSAFLVCKFKLIETYCKAQHHHKTLASAQKPIVEDEDELVTESYSSFLK